MTQHEELVDRNELMLAYGNMVDGYTRADDTVRLMVTLTFRPGPEGQLPGPQKGRKAIEAYKIETAEWVSAAFFTEERGTLNDRLHYHGILAVRGDIELGVMLTHLKEAWKEGFSKIEALRSSNGVFYVCKYIMKDQADGNPSWFEYWKKDAIQRCLL